MLWFLIGGFGLVVLAHTAPFPFLLESFRPSHSIWHMPVDAAPATIYLTFDDGPNPGATPALLDVLRDANAHATFFLIDSHLTEATAPIVRRMFDEGHAVGLHSDTRALMIKTPLALADHLRQNAARIEALTGRPPCRLFRPHAGWRSGSMYDGLDQIDYRLVGWTWGLWDWNWYRQRNAAAIVRRIVSKSSPGDIVVMHDGHHVNPAADRQYTVDAIRELVPALRAKGYQFGILCGTVEGS